MKERINQLAKLTLRGEMCPTPIETDFDRNDIFLSEHQKASKRLSEFILNQEPIITEFSRMTGFFRYNGSVYGDYFNFQGNKHTGELMEKFYLKHIDNISVMEWQHAVADFEKVLKKGISGIINDIDISLNNHTEPEKIDYLNALKNTANTFILWAHKCSKKVREFAEGVENKQYRENLNKLSDALLRVPENKPTSFYEAVLSVYVCFAIEPDGIGLPDRYLYPYYIKDINDGVITREEAKEYLQEFFLMLQSATPYTSPNFTKGGQSHFAVGGYLADGSNGYNALSELIIESLMELPTYIPEITFRWNEKTPREVFRYVLDCERKDPFKRIAFQNDEKRIKSYTEICGMSYEDAVKYTLTGCNEPAFPGEISASTSKVNVLRCIDTIFHKNADNILTAKTFEEFYDIFEKELVSDLDIAYEYDDKYNLIRAKDYDYVSSLLFNNCIEEAKSIAHGAGKNAISSPMLIGMVNLIDCLIIVKQFVYDEKRVAIDELVSALKSNWEGFENLRLEILKTGDFFGNDTDRSNEVAQRLYTSLYNYLKDKRTVFGFPILVGDHTGYNQHFHWFGNATNATPDGRCKGQPLKYGINQAEDKDRNGLSALMNSISKADPTGISCGATVTNFTLDEQLIKNDALFDKTVEMLETYFKNGGKHFQLNYVSKEDLIKAKNTPENYKNLRVRVTGFSDNFVNLHEDVQDSIIRRTSQK